jgi:ketosteroid isomerase-like protein
MHGSLRDFQDNEAASQVVDRLHQLIDALAALDYQTLDEIWADDWTFTSATGSISTKKETMQALRSGLLVYKPQDYQQDSVRVYGSSAVMLGRFTIQGSVQGQDISGSYRVLDMFFKMGERWWVVAEQATRILTG